MYGKSYNFHFFTKSIAKALKKLPVPVVPALCRRKRRPSVPTSARFRLKLQAEINGILQLVQCENEN